MAPGFPGSSAGKEFVCIAGDPGLIPGLGRSAEEGIGYPLQYSWASLVTQVVKESTCNVGDLGSLPGLGRSPGEGNPATHASISPWGCKESDMTGRRSLFLRRVLSTNENGCPTAARHPG